MSKAFTDNERKHIKNRLMEEAQECLKLYGIRKTTVDELVKRVNISKGTFYLFFKSKEHLFYEVLCSFHDKLHTDLMNRFKAIPKPVSVEQITQLTFWLYKQVEESFLYKVITSGDFELLIRKLPPDMIHSYVKRDDFSIEQIMSMVPGINSRNIKTFSAAMRAIFLTMLHKKEIGEEVFEEAVRLMIRGVVIQIFEEDSK